MKDRVTYRAITVAVGILVAIIVAMTLWARSPEEPAMVRNMKAPAIPKQAPPILKKAVQLILSIN